MFRDQIRGDIDTAMNNEVICEFICRNICELDAEPVRARIGAGVLNLVPRGFGWQ
jgi:hypothetical protein